MDSNVQAASTLIVWVVFALIATFLFAVPAIVSWWVLYTKAGKPGWAAIVPFYSTWVMAQIGKQATWIAIVVIVAGLGANFIYKPLNLVAAGFGLYLLYAVTKQFDRGIGFWLLVIFLPIIGVFQVKKANYTGTSSAGPDMYVPPTAPQPPVAPSPPAMPMA